LEYLDNFSDEIGKGDEFCYQLKLAQAPSDTFVIADTSLSNELCFKMEPDIFIPNSFTPNNDGKNESWRPRTSYLVPIDNYNLQIYDRWGKLAFETTNPLEGWSGERNEGFAAEGVYLYHLEITTVHGSKIDRKGNFNLVR
jgi:gliding motility-associated-like protein